jgi:prevent-host-death family protein
MKTVTIREAKIYLSQLLQEACEGKEVVIVRTGKPIVRLVPIPDIDGPRKPGVLRGKLRVSSEFFEPLSDQE